MFLGVFGFSSPRNRESQHGGANPSDVRRSPAADLHPNASRQLPALRQLVDVQITGTAGGGRRRRRQCINAARQRRRARLTAARQRPLSAPSLNKRTSKPTSHQQQPQNRLNNDNQQQTCANNSIVFWMPAA